MKMGRVQHGLHCRVPRHHRQPHWATHPNCPAARHDATKPRTPHTSWPSRDPARSMPDRLFEGSATSGRPDRQRETSLGIPAAGEVEHDGVHRHPILSTPVHPRPSAAPQPRWRRLSPISRLHRVPTRMRGVWNGRTSPTPVDHALHMRTRRHPARGDRRGLLPNSRTRHTSRQRLWSAVGVLTRHLGPRCQMRGVRSHHSAFPPTAT